MASDILRVLRSVWLRQPWLFTLGCTSFFLHIAGVREYLAYQRPLIAQGELWRLMTGHLVHLGTGHLVENLAGLLLIGLLCGDQFTSRQWAFVTLVSAMTVSVALYLFNPDLIWYVGLSGLLYGLLVAGAIAQLKSPRTRQLAGMVLLLVAVKIGWEQLVGALPGSEWLTGGAVVVDAHLYGAVSGLVAQGGLRWLPGSVADN